MGFVSSLVSYRFFTLICRQYTQQSQTDVTLCQSLRKTQVVVYSACAVLNSHGLGYYLEIAINLRKWVENGTRIQSQFDPLAYYSIHTTIMCNFKNFLNTYGKNTEEKSKCLKLRSGIPGSITSTHIVMIMSIIWDIYGLLHA